MKRIWLAVGRHGQLMLRRPMGLALRTLSSRRTRIVLLDGQGRVALARVWLSPQPRLADTEAESAVVEAGRCALLSDDADW